jgi:hypothetical protein
MKHRIVTVLSIVAALALLTALAPLAALAQQPTQDRVPIKGSLTGVGDSFLIPMDPPILSSRVTATGQAELLGQKFPVTLISASYVTLGVDGIPLSITDGHEVVSYPEGSAAFVHINGSIRPSSKAGFLTMEGTWTVTGGRGMFLGASGSGTWRAEQEIATGRFTQSWEGFEVLPNVKKPQ